MEGMAFSLNLSIFTPSLEGFLKEGCQVKVVWRGADVPPGPSGQREDDGVGNLSVFLQQK